MPRNGQRRTEYADFLTIVDKSGECWIFTGSLDKDGYGQIMINRRNVRAHRYAYENEVGSIPKGMLLLHLCDNPSCVRVSHLRIGNHQDNMVDRNSKNRQHRSRGELDGMAKLNRFQVIEIRKDTRTQREIANDYKISQQHVSEIKRGIKWGWLKESDLAVE